MRMFVGILGVACALIAAVAVAGAAPAPSATSEARATRQPIDLVYISDSSGWGVAALYGRRISKTSGVPVRVHDEWSPNLAALQILQELRSGASRFPRLIREAEVIVVYGNPVGLEIVRGGDCVTSTEPPRSVGPQAWVKYVAGMKAIYKQIFRIRNGRPVVLRTANWYVPAIKTWDEAGILTTCTKKWESFSAAIAKAAAAYRVPVADVYSAFNGTTHREDPVAKGYIQADGIHPNNKGRAVIARTLTNLGFKSVRPPH